MPDRNYQDDNARFLEKIVVGAFCAVGIAPFAYSIIAPDKWYNLGIKLSLDPSQDKLYAVTYGAIELSLLGIAGYLSKRNNP